MKNNCRENTLCKVLGLPYPPKTYCGDSDMDFWSLPLYALHGDDKNSFCQFGFQIVDTDGISIKGADNIYSLVIVSENSESKSIELAYDKKTGLFFQYSPKEAYAGMNTAGMYFVHVYHKVEKSMVLKSPPIYALPDISEEDFNDILNELHDISDYLTKKNNSLITVPFKIR